jgi:hypothetical protein
MIPAMNEQEQKTPLIRNKHAESTPIWVVDSDFARSLEKQRDELKEALETSLRRLKVTSASLSVSGFRTDGIDAEISIIEALLTRNNDKKEDK